MKRKASLLRRVRIKPVFPRCLYPQPRPRVRLRQKRHNAWAKTRFKVVDAVKEKYEWTEWFVLSDHRGDVCCPSYAGRLRRIPDKFSIQYDMYTIHPCDFSFVKKRCAEHGFSFNLRIFVAGQKNYFCGGWEDAKFVFEFKNDAQMILFKLFISELS